MSKKLSIGAINAPCAGDKGDSEKRAIYRRVRKLCHFLLLNSPPRTLGSLSKKVNSIYFERFNNYPKNLLCVLCALCGKVHLMKILLIQPPVRDFYQTPIRTQPVGLAYLAASLEQNSFEVEILDCQVTTQKKSIPMPESFFHIKEFYPRRDISPFRLFGEYYHFGLSYEEVSARIRQSNADAIGISSQFTPYCAEALTIASLVKSLIQDSR